MRRDRVASAFAAALVAAFLGVNAGCSVVGMAAGAAYGNRHGRPVPLESLERTYSRRDVHMRLVDGRVISGSVVVTGSPDSVSLDCPRSGSARSAFSDPVERRAFARKTVVKCEVPDDSYQFAGLVVGTCVDLYLVRVLVQAIATPHHFYKFAQAGGGR